MLKLNTLIAAALSVVAVGSSHASYLSSPGSNHNSLTMTRAAALAQFERAQPASAVTKQALVKRAAAPVAIAVTPSAATFAAPNLGRAQGRVAYLRALASGDVAAASRYDFGTQPSDQRAVR